jgi:hypothetical protein
MSRGRVWPPKYNDPYARVVELKARISELEAENARLKVQLQQLSPCKGDTVVVTIHTGNYWKHITMSFDLFVNGAGDMGFVLDEIREGVARQLGWVPK